MIGWKLVAARNKRACFERREVEFEVTRIRVDSRGARLEDFILGEAKRAIEGATRWLRIVVLAGNCELGRQCERSEDSSEEVLERNAGNEVDSGHIADIESRVESTHGVAWERCQVVARSE